jgi:hypothetical protein
VWWRKVGDTREVVRDSAKWSEVFVKRLEEVRRRAWAIGAKGRYLRTIYDVDRGDRTMWNDVDDSR